MPALIVEGYRLRGIVLKQGYGLTGAGVNCFAMSEAEAQAKPGSIGKPMLFSEVALMQGGRPSTPCCRASRAIWAGA